MPYDKDGKYYRLPTNSVNKNNQSSKKSKKEATNFFKVEKKDKPVDKNKASKKDPINFFKAEKKNTTETPKFDWKNDKRLIAFSYVFLGSSIFYFLSQVFAPAPQQNIRTPLFVPIPTQPRRIDPALQRSINRRNQILNPSGVRCSQGLGLTGEPTINCQRF